MKATDLMVGDRVLYDDGKNIVTGRVDMVCKGIIVFNGVPMPEEYIRPIPLTIVDLHKNGIVGKPDFMLAISLVKNAKYATTFNTVHELQHALRLCGLTELADNFQSRITTNKDKTK